MSANAPSYYALICVLTDMKRNSIPVYLFYKKGAENANTALPIFNELLNKIIGNKMKERIIEFDVPLSS